MKKILNITGAVVGLALVAAVVVYSRVPVKKTNAQASAPTVSIAFDQGGPGVTQSSGQTSMSNAKLTISSGGPFTEDFQLQICITSVNAPYQFCGTTPWASTSGGSMVWSPWVWPGYNNGLNVTNPGLVTVSVNTRPLPAGTTLNNVVLGLGIAEANGGPSSLASNLSLSSPCDYGYTPAGGGSTPNVYGYVYGSCSNGPSGSPDDIQVGISASVGGASLTGTVPSQMDAGATDTNSTITATNLGNTPLVQNSWTELATGPGTGTCDTDPDANGVDTGTGGTFDANGNPVTETCSITIDLIADNLELTHTGVFTTPATIPYVIHNVAKVTTASPGYEVVASYAGEDQYGSGINCEPGANNDPDLGSNDDCSYYASGTSSVTYNGASPTNLVGIPPGGTGTFAISSLTAPSTPGSYLETWTLSNASGPLGAYTQAIQVGGGGGTPTSTPPSGATGTITVTSQNAVTGDPVNAQWDFWDDPSLLYPNGTDLCLNGPTCVGSAQTYTDQPAVDPNGNPGVTYTIPEGSVTLASPSQSDLYGLKSVRQAPIAQKKVTNIDSMLSLIKNIFGSTAEAWTTPLDNPLAQELYPASTTSYILLWSPIANMEVSSTPPSLWLTSQSGTPASGQIQVINDGAPGSTLTWTASSDSSWLTASPSSDSSGITNGSSGNASDVVTINAASLPAGNYTGTITFNGISTSYRSPNRLVATLTVSYDVTATAPTSTPATVSAVRIIGCDPSTVNTNQSSACSATVSGTGSYDPSVSWTSSIPTISPVDADDASFSSPSVGVATITACSNQAGYTNVCDTTQVTVTAPPPPACVSGVSCPVCSPVLTANPASIVVPESSELSYSCKNVNECTLSGSDGSSYPINWVSATTASGTQSVDPSMTTVYTLSCTNTNYSPSSANLSLPVQVTVSNSNRCEQNPNGAGCTGQ